jgi:Ca2+/Na+ antiporter
MSALIVLILVAAIIAFFMLRSGENLRFETSSDPHRVVMAAVGIIGAKRRWQTMAQSEHGANFQYHKGPKVLVAIILLLCFLIPGIVYVLLAGKRESLVVNIDSATAGMTVVQVTSNGFRGKAAGRALQRQVSVPAGALGTGAEPVLTAGE